MTEPFTSSQVSKPFKACDLVSPQSPISYPKPAILSGWNCAETTSFLRAEVYSDAELSTYIVLYVYCFVLKKINSVRRNKVPTKREAVGKSLKMYGIRYIPSL